MGRARAQGGRWVAMVLLIGAFVTLRGYRSLEGDQAYRLPILVHQNEPTVFARDPFVRSFDTFNPHRGALALIGLASRPLGLPLALAGLFGLTILTTCVGLDRSTRLVWPEAPDGVGLCAVGLALAATAGNIGTNHLVEPILLDRQVAFALGWLGLSFLLEETSRGVVRAALALAGATLVHPTLGLQLGLLFCASWAVWALLRRAPDARAVILTAAGLAGLALAVVPGLWLNLAGSGRLLEGVDLATFRILSVELQGPQHMLPHLWRRPEWLAWACYPLLAAISFRRGAGRLGSTARDRLAVVLALSLVGLGLAWWGIERLGHLRLTLFQPFRIATVTRGLCLMFLADHWLRLWSRGGLGGRIRAVSLVVGLTGDWRMVVVSAVEAAFLLGERLRGETEARRGGFGWSRLPGCMVLGLGLAFLARHDTESGHLPLLAAGGVSVVVLGWWGDRPWAWTPGRRARLALLAWGVPILALGVELTPEGMLPGVSRGERDALARRYRFREVAADDTERLALWCRAHTPVDARFVGPPGPKTFRLWSRRSLAFNRAGSPYNARGLVDWAERFRAHVGFDGSFDAFTRAYVRDRHGVERGYDRLSGPELAALADCQEARFVVAAAPGSSAAPGLNGSGLTLLHAEGRLAVYERTAPRWAEAENARRSR